MEDFQNMWDGGAKDKKSGPPKFILIHNPILKNERSNQSAKQKQKKWGKRVFFWVGGRFLVFLMVSKEDDEEIIYDKHGVSLTHSYFKMVIALMLLAVAVVVVMLLCTLQYNSTCLLFSSLGIWPSYLSWSFCFILSWVTWKCTKQTLLFGQKFNPLELSEIWVWSYAGWDFFFLKYTIGIQGEMKPRKPSILVVVWVSSCLSFCLSASPLLLHIFSLLLTVQLL